MNSSLLLSKDSILRFLPQDQTIALQIVPVTSSSNADLYRLALQGAPEGTILFAEQQSAGRGRLSRSWDSPPYKNLYFSILFRPSVAPAEVSSLTLVLGAALHKALKEIVPELRLKWPNDLLVHGKKLGGILCESHLDADQLAFVVAGIGLNINAALDDFSDPVRKIATSLFLETGQFHCRSELAGRLLASIFEAYQRFRREGFAPFQQEWNEAAQIQGRKIQGVDSSYEGICQGVDAHGRLIVQTETGTQPVLSGEIKMEEP